MTSFEQTAHVRCPLERPVPESRTRPCRIHGHLDFRTDGVIDRVSFGAGWLGVTEYGQRESGKTQKGKGLKETEK